MEEELDIEKRFQEEGITITKDMIMRELFSLTNLGDEFIKAVLPDLGKFKGKGEIQKVLGSTSKYYVVFDYYRITEKYLLDLEIQHSPDPDIRTRMEDYLLWLNQSILSKYGGRKKKGIVIVYLDHWSFSKDHLLVKEFDEENSEKVNGQIYYVNINYQGKGKDTYLYQLCQDLHTVERHLSRKLKTKIIHDVLEYYTKEGGKKQVMKDIEVLLNQREEKGVEKQKEKTLRKMILSSKYSDSEIADINDVPVSEIPALRKKYSVAK